jgi:hypothetical protein
VMIFRGGRWRTARQSSKALNEIASSSTSDGAGIAAPARPIDGGSAER